MQHSTLKNPEAEHQAQTRAILIANPTSGSYLLHAQQIKETVTFLREHGWQAELKLTQRAGDARRFAREAVEQDIGVVVATGGDGTINEVIQELAGSETALGVLPSGTVNVWAREMNIPLDNYGARNVLLNGQIKRVDLGKLNDSAYFLLMGGVGMDGDITHAVERKPAKRLGILGYALVGAWLGLGYQPFRTYLQVDKHKIKVNALQVIVGNTQLYGGAIKYTWEAKCDDGILDVCIVHQRNIVERLLVVLDFLLRRKRRHQWVRYEKCKELTIVTQRRIGIQLDGDPFGYTNEGLPATRFSIAPRALKVIVPQNAPANLFTEEIEEA